MIIALISIIIFLIGIVGGIYVGGWLMFVKPIIDICMAIDSGTITAMLIGVSIVKIVFAGIVGYLIFILGTFIAKAILD